MDNELSPSCTEPNNYYRDPREGALALLMCVMFPNCCFVVWWYLPGNDGGRTSGLPTLPGPL